MGEVSRCSGTVEKGAKEHYYVDRNWEIKSHSTDGYSEKKRSAA